MTKRDVAQSDSLKLLVAAYKLRLARDAREKFGGRATWGKDNEIKEEGEETLLAGAEQLRASPYPYPGLRSFAPDEGETFFGRDRNVEQVRNCLSRQRTVVVLGGSGSGKSSLIRAGLLPYLNTKHRIEGRSGSWYSVEFRPRTEPFHELTVALVEQLFLPLLDVNAPGLAKALNVEGITDRQEVRSSLVNQTKDLFDRAKKKKKGRAALLSLLRYIANRLLDKLDRLASEGVRASKPSLLLLLDQFEEVFRTEVEERERDFLLDLIVDFHEHTRRATKKGALFLAVTMRSEELHRCAEHRGLSEVVNQSTYLLELLDANNPDDEKDLRRAIVQPARNVFDEWGLCYDKNDPDSPFEPGMPAWIIDGAKTVSTQLAHKPDQLPLFQHSLQAMWHGAMRRWSEKGVTDDGPRIMRTDLPGQATTDADSVADLRACLRQRADKAADEAITYFVERTGIPGDDGRAAGEVAVQAAFRALARRDDRRNWARRFAKKGDIIAYLAADRGEPPTTLSIDARWDALEKSLHPFLLRGYLTRGTEGSYDISHEALIRTWETFDRWLREPDEVAYALNRVIVEVEPANFSSEGDEEKAKQIPQNVAQKVADVAAGTKLPLQWAKEQIAPILLDRTYGVRWGESSAALAKAGKLCEEADNARQRIAASKKHEEEIAARRIRAFVAACAVLLVGAAFFWLSGNESTKSAKRMGTVSLIGSMQADQNLWPKGVRERAAVHALNVVGGGEAEELPADVAEDLLWTRWDTGVRSILGRRFFISKEGNTVDTTKQGEICMVAKDTDAVQPGPSKRLDFTKSAEVRPVVNVDKERRRVFIETRPDQNSPWMQISQDLPLEIEVGDQVCLSPGGGFLATTRRDNRLPFLYILNWRQCESDDNQDSCAVGRWKVEIAALQTVGLDETQMPPVGAKPCIWSISEAEPFLNVDFTAGEPAACNSSTAKADYRASYMPAAAFPRPILESPVSSSLSKLEGQPVSIPIVDSPSLKTIEFAWRVGDGYVVKKKHERVATEVNSQTNDYSSLSLESTQASLWAWMLKQLGMTQTPSVPIVLLKQFNVRMKIDQAGLDDQKNLILRDSNKQLWLIATNLKQFESALRQRASKDPDKFDRELLLQIPLAQREALKSEMQGGVRK